MTQYALMPLKKNVPEPKNPDWRETKCPECGASCWESNLLRQARTKYTGIKAVCTMCGLKKHGTLHAMTGGEQREH